MTRHHLINGVQVPFTAEEEAQRDAEEAAWNAGAFDRAMADLRSKRDRLLASCDWVMMNDSPIADKTTWETYRQSLSGYLHLFNPSSTTFVKHFISRTQSTHYDDYSYDLHKAGYFNTTSSIDAIKFRMSLGNIESGEILLFGIN